MEGQDKVSTVKALITDLQELKKRQLVQLQRLPTLQYKDLLEKNDEIIDDEKSYKLISSLGAFRDQRTRLLCKLAFDVNDLSVALEKKSTAELTRKIRRKYFLQGDDFLIKSIPVHPLLLEWCLELKKHCKESGKEVIADTSPFALPDKEAYDIKYEPFCSNCKETIGLADAKNCMPYPLDGHRTALLGFSSCRNGVCCRIRIECKCKICPVESPDGNSNFASNQFEENNIQVTIDPWHTELSNVAFINQCKQYTALRFVREQVWTSIDNRLKLGEGP